MNSEGRKDFFNLLKSLVTTKSCSDKTFTDAIEKLAIRCQDPFGSEPYGIADEVYFGSLTSLVQRLFAYDNKHYYIYKAIDNPNKIGYLSRRWYYILSLNEKLWIKQGATSLRRSKLRVEFLRSHGTMASPTKILKLAFAENPNATQKKENRHLQIKHAGCILDLGELREFLPENRPCHSADASGLSPGVSEFEMMFQPNRRLTRL